MRVLLQNSEESHKQEWFEIPVDKPTKQSDITYRLTRLSRTNNGKFVRLHVTDVESDMPNLSKSIEKTASLEKINQLDYELRKLSYQEKALLSFLLVKRQAKTVNHILSIIESEF